jgi:hypothetical protein
MGGEGGRAGTLGGADVPMVGGEGWPEPPEVRVDEARAQQGAGVRRARRWSGLGRNSMKSQSNCTLKTIPGW